MKVLLFTHKSDIDGMGSAVLANLVCSEYNNYLEQNNYVEYVLCGTFNLTENVLKYYDDGRIYEYDKIFIVDLCLEEPLLSRINNDKLLSGKVLNLDHHKTFDNERYTKYPFVRVVVKNELGLCSGTSLFYEYLVDNGYINKNNLAIKEFVELTRQHDTWEWKNIYNNEKARELATFFDVVGCDAYIKIVQNKLFYSYDDFTFDSYEKDLIDNRLTLINEKVKMYADKVIYRDILGLRAGIVFITYEYRNELAEYFRENNFDMDFVMMIAMDPGVVCYRSVRDDVNVRHVAEYFDGKGHDKAGSNPINEKIQNKLVRVLTKK